LFEKEAEEKRGLGIRLSIRGGEPSFPRKLLRGVRRRVFLGKKKRRGEASRLGLINFEAEKELKTREKVRKIEP